MADPKPPAASPKSPSHVFVQSKFDSIHTIGFTVHDQTQKSPEGHPRVVRQGEVTLYPGVNQVPAADWAAAAHPQNNVVQHHLKTKKLKVLKSGELPEDENKAIKMVQECIREEVLRQWHREEERSEVLSAIEDQIKELKIDRSKTKKEADTGEDEDSEDEDT